MLEAVLKENSGIQTNKREGSLCRMLKNYKIKLRK